MSQPFRRDVAILICSRGRADHLTRLLADLHRSFLPALREGGLSATVFVYAQGYPADYLQGLARDFAPEIASRDMVLHEATKPHRRIGEVVEAAIRAVHLACRYDLAMLMDDDSVFHHDEAVSENLRNAACRFIDEGHRAYSIKLGAERSLAFGPFVHGTSPIMPFKEKMMWVSRAVLDGVLATPRFAEISIGEDAVIAAIAWLGGPRSCFAVHGMASFLHLSFEGEEAEDPATEMEGGYAELVGFTGDAAREAGATKYDAALTSGVTPHHVMPHVFVGEDHPHFAYNGIRPELALRLAASEPETPGREAPPLRSGSLEPAL